MKLRDQKFRALPVSLGLSQRYVFAGPFIHRPDGMFGIKLAAEINVPCDISIPIVDYGVPESADVVRTALQRAVAALVKEEPLYVGCMGGFGRTGTFLALLVKALGVREPIPYVREFYDHRAVERDSQVEYIAEFDVRPLFWGVAWSSGLAAFHDLSRAFTGRRSAVALAIEQGHWGA